VNLNLEAELGLRQVPGISVNALAVLASVSAFGYILGEDRIIVLGGICRL
jgi:hypothetical protein